MKIDILIEALQALMVNRIMTAEDAKDITDALCELHDQRNRLHTYGSGRLEEVHVVPATTVHGLVNLELYNVIGKELRKNDNFMSYNTTDELRYHFVGPINNSYDLNVYALEGGIYYVIDLWKDNERFGYNAPDGTFFE